MTKPTGFAPPRILDAGTQFCHGPQDTMTQPLVFRLPRRLFAGRGQFGYELQFGYGLPDTTEVP